MRRHNSEDEAMVWSTSHIFWREQLMLLSILLSPIFISMMLLALSAPRLFAPKQVAKHKKEDTPQVSTRLLPNSR
jgi:hypothetical protein